MTSEEFSDWMAYHQAAFPGVAKWMRDNTPKDATTEERPVYHWRWALSDVDVLDAKLATDAMLSGDLDEPRGYSSHPRVIRKWCRVERYTAKHHTESTQRTTIDGETVYDCPQCLDIGTVPVVHPKVHQQVYREVPYGELRWATAVVACSCDAGDKWRQPCSIPGGRVRHALPTFDDYRMYGVDGMLTDESKAAFWNWLNNKPVESHPNYNPEFA